MNSWKVILATMVIFGAGVITGGLLVKNTTGSQVVEPRKVVVRTNLPPVNVTPPQMMRMEFLLRARKELGLSSEQHERIEKIIREGQERSRKLWEGVAPEMRKELQSVNERIRAELSPEQRRLFEQLLKSAPRAKGAENNLQPRERLRQGGPGNPDDPQLNPKGQPRLPRRENPPPLENPPPPGGPAPAESR